MITPQPPYATTKYELIAQVRDAYTLLNQVEKDRDDALQLLQQAITTLNDLKKTCEEWMARAVEAEARL
jgi:hypothetical protein